MMNKPATANSKGLRFGSFVQIRDIFEEEFENMLAGKQDAKAALDNSVKRGNEMLRRFEKTAKDVVSRCGKRHARLRRLRTRRQRT